MAKCRSCGAAITWTLTRSGKKMPVDSLPAEDGNFYLEKGEDGEFYSHHVRGYPGKLPEDVYRHHSHFSTCPNADEHRGAR